ncbi:LysR family transcriptional regulator [Thauera sp. SDU_THAU2]|uniref:LysR family transcriptional regulator n=1 Tax=Thauera sp. SDU_THAU2 TaxID=3136633 RepID=UPI00311E79E5
MNTLATFSVAAHRLNFSHAGEDLNITHAAVSNQMKRLEDWFGRKLFERSGRGLKLTAAGEELLRSGRRVAFHHRIDKPEAAYLARPPPDLRRLPAVDRHAMAGASPRRLHQAPAGHIGRALPMRRPTRVSTRSGTTC